MDRVNVASVYLAKNMNRTVASKSLTINPHLNHRSYSSRTQDAEPAAQPTEVHIVSELDCNNAFVGDWKNTMSYAQDLIKTSYIGIGPTVPTLRPGVEPTPILLCPAGDVEGDVPSCIGGV